MILRLQTRFRQIVHRDLMDPEFHALISTVAGIIDEQVRDTEHGRLSKKEEHLVRLAAGIAIVVSDEHRRQEGLRHRLGRRLGEEVRFLTQQAALADLPEGPQP